MMSSKSVVASADHEPAIASPRDLLLRFESLGGMGHGCEFGVFQRRYGAEPLGLLRWADLHHLHLISALESRFDGVGMEENTIIFQNEGSDEWWTRDTQYWMAMRTFVKSSDVGLDKFKSQVCGRLRFLRTKLIDDLETGEKLFVFRNMFENLTDAELKRLHAAVRQYGDSTLFYLRYSNEDHHAGTVEVRERGLLIGYIERFWFSREDQLIGPVFEALFALCEQAYAIHSVRVGRSDPLPEAP